MQMNRVEEKVEIEGQNANKEVNKQREEIGKEKGIENEMSIKCDTCN